MYDSEENRRRREEERREREREREREIRKQAEQEEKNRRERQDRQREHERQSFFNAAHGVPYQGDNPSLGPDENRRARNQHENASYWFKGGNTGSTNSYNNEAFDSNRSGTNGTSSYYNSSQYSGNSVKSNDRKIIFFILLTIFSIGGLWYAISCYNQNELERQRFRRMYGYGMDEKKLVLPIAIIGGKNQELIGQISVHDLPQDSLYKKLLFAKNIDGTFDLRKLSSKLVNMIGDADIPSHAILVVRRVSHPGRTWYGKKTSEVDTSFNLP